MRGVFVSNAYLTGPKFSEPAAMLSAAAADMGVDMECVTNADLVFPVGDAEAAAGILGDADFVLFWDKDVRLAENIELCGYPVFNTSRCISVCDDKSLTHLALSRSGVPSIFTVSVTNIRPLFSTACRTWRENVGLSCTFSAPARTLPSL